MKHIVIFGAGKSSTCLIEYLIRQSAINDWRLTVLDADPEAARLKIGHATRARAASLNVEHEVERKEQVASADIVVSLLPPSLHYLIALDCLECGKNLLTASYIDPRMERLRTDIERRGLLFLCEMGLDPGIDHMSAMKIIHRLQRENAEVVSFRSHCGGLVAPESDDNPWRYKISWNPRNVVLAGKGGAVYRENDREIHLPYEQLFDAQRQVQVEGLGSLAYYPNRDSLSYISLYQLPNVSDFVRTTLRYPEFCLGWQKIVALKLTDEMAVYDTDGQTIREFFEGHFKRNGARPSDYAAVKDQLIFLGLHDDLTVINKGKCSAADVLQFILENKLPLTASDRDMVVMLHEIEFRTGNILHSTKSRLVVAGEDHMRTAMAKTVGLPLGIAATMILQEKIQVKGLHIPVISEIYEPVLHELEQLGIRFLES